MMALLFLFLSWTASAAPMDPAALPPELQGWVGWVRAGHPEWSCPVVGGQAACVWPGRLSVDADASGARLTLDVTVDRALDLPLPGGAGTWPQGLTVDGRAAVVRTVGASPHVALTEGAHRLVWSLRWAQRPPALPLPASIGLVDLVVDGARVALPQIDADGRLRLGAGDTSGPGENRLEVEVYRRVADGVPVRVTTRVDLRTSGKARELDLGAVLVAGSRPVSLAADLPARLTPEGRLVVQVRPGSFSVTIDALVLDPVTALTAPQVEPPWPVQEVWSVATDDRVRTVNLSGPVGVDPARTAMPGDWRALPAFLVEPGVPLAFEELRRGEPEPPVNQLALARELWLDLDGQGLTIRDRFSGALQRDWRLDVVEPAILGHVAVNGEDQVITARDGARGVELRSSGLSLVAEARVEGAVRELSAVGWSADVQQLSATLHVPPGWELLWVSGADDVGGLDPWSLFDLFYVLVLALSFGKLLGWRWGALALLALSVARHEAGAPGWIWVFLLLVVAVERALASGAVRSALTGLRWGLLIVLFGLLVPFSIDQLQGGLFPQLQQSWMSAGEVLERYDGYEPGLTSVPQAAGEGQTAGDMADEELLQEQQADGDWNLRSRSAPAKGKLAYLSKQADPAAVVQTGPGLPTWSWTQHSLSWSGPVGAGHAVRLWLIGPSERLGLALVRVGLLLLLALRLAGVARLGPAVAPGLVVLIAAALAPAPAHAAPDAALLEELARRLQPDLACAPHCVAAASGVLQLAGDTLTVEVELHAVAEASWPLPGPASAWVPSSVVLDGRPAGALARLSDGFLHVRLSPGVHRLVVSGPLPATDALALQFADPPQRLDLRADGWTVEGVKADGTVAGTVQLVRTQADGRGEATTSENLAPWVEVRRQLDLGLPWRVQTEVVRVGPASQPLALRVPLLPGESVTDEGFEVRDGVVLVTLARDVTSVGWLSTLEPVERLVLSAPSAVPWTEQWTVSCSPIFACAAEGPAPLRHIVDERWSPVWRVWPGESVALAVTRPDAVVGQTLTIDGARFRWRPGVRLGEGELTLSVRTSQGGQLPVTLPEGASLREVRIAGEAKPLQLRDDRTLPLPLRPGANDIVLTWQQPHEAAFRDVAPAIALGAPAVNVTVEVESPPGRWILALRGPDWGPVPLYGVYLVLVLLAAPLLARLPFAPLSMGQWALLGLGMTQVPVFVPIGVVLCIMAIGARGRHPLKAWWAFDLLQLALVPVVLALLGMLYAAIHAGLLVQPDMQVEGNGSSDQLLRWYVDRIDGDVFQPTVYSLPLWVFRVGMLLWSLWLAALLVRQARWVWGCVSEGGLWRAPEAAVRPPKPEAAG